MAKRRKGDLKGAISDYDRTIEIDPKYAIAYLNRGNARDEKGDLEGAIADYTAASNSIRKIRRPTTTAARSTLKRRSTMRRSWIHMKAIELKPNNGGYYLDLGWYQLFNRKPREAITASLKALELSPDNTVVIKTNLAHGYLFDNQFDKAKTIYLENKMPKSATTSEPSARPRSMISRNSRTQALRILTWKRSKHC